VARSHRRSREAIVEVRYIAASKEFDMDAAHDLARTARARRNGLALAAFVAPWGIVLANAGYAWTTRHGGEDLTAAGDLALAQAHRTIGPLASLAAIIGSLLLVPAVLGAMRLVRLGAARLGLIGGVLTAGGYICYLGMLMQGMVSDAMARAGGSTAEQVRLLNAIQDQPLTIWVFLFFVVGNLIGTFLLGLALLRARTVPFWAAYGVIAWPVLHIVGMAAGTEWFEVAGAILQAIGFAGVGLSLLRAPLLEADPQAAVPYELLRK
jgi:hypothetical protein